MIGNPANAFQSNPHSAVVPPLAPLFASDKTTQSSSFFTRVQLAAWKQTSIFLFPRLSWGAWFSELGELTSWTGRRRSGVCRSRKLKRWDKLLESGMVRSLPRRSARKTVTGGQVARAERAMEGWLKEQSSELSVGKNKKNRLRTQRKQPTVALHWLPLRRSTLPR